jgi:NADH dehydrogenase [ubiquinone] 1 alpha subcomplex assembly factor 5
MFSYDVIFQNHRRFQSVFKQHDFIFKVASEECLESLSELQIAPTSILILGHFPLIEQLQQTYPNATINYKPEFNPTLETTSTYDLIISIGQFQWINDPITYLNTIKSILKPKAVFYGIFPGEDSFKALHKALIKAEMVLRNGASQRIIPMVSASDTLSLMQAAAFKNPLVHIASLELHHNTIYDLMNDIKGMGGSNPLSDRPKEFAPKKLFSLANSYLIERKNDIESIIDLIVMIGHK